ncbi:MAG: porphobilinogen synthase [Alphaproteobacteria bacterium]|nr:porphobilinogen synthase [Alphaproteobacteria bacterium]
MAQFPTTRLRRMRQHDWSRRLMRENTLTTDDLIWTLVVTDKAESEPVAAMPGTKRLTFADAAKAAVEARALGIPAIAIFPNIDSSLKDARGSQADDPNGLVGQAIKAMKDAAPEVGIICDVALDPFTDHGHDGLMENGIILNDPTIERLCQQAICQARAGCDVIAPSDMMDGRVGALRAALDSEGFEDVMILSYAAKYASAFYGPYRDAIGSSAALQGDKKTYQMDPANTDESIREVELDIAEGADMVMVKPGLPYLDIVARVKDAFALPTYAFQVSGEYAMIEAAAANGWIDGERAMMESLLAFKRAGADGVLTYFAPRAAKVLGG